VKATPCGIYVRISSDPSGKGLGVARQEKACRTKAAGLGWRVANIYTDNDVSASSGRPRPAYARMLEDLEHGTIGAVVVWDLDRLTRRPIEIEHFIDVADRKRVSLASVGGDVDLSTDNGRMFARIKGAVARAEVERKGARQKAANDQRAESGVPFAGRRAFGYSADGRAVVDTEAAEFRRAVAELLAGESLRAIVRGMGQRGVRTTAGNVWRRPTELRRLLQNPRHAGLRVHRGVVVGPGQWPSIIDQDTHQAVLAILSDPGRRKAGRPRRYLLTGLAKCGVCGGGIYGVTEPRGPLYYCETRRHVARRAEKIDELVEGVIVARLALADAAEMFARADDKDRANSLRTEEGALRARLDGLAEAFAVGDIDRQALRAGTRRVNARLEVVSAELTTLASVPDIAPLLSAEDVEAEWVNLDVDRRRAVIETLIDVTIHPAGRGARSFDAETIKIEWKGQK
jgi:DNA invertase Pin-like site-specific DNA recombinase